MVAFKFKLRFKFNKMNKLANIYNGYYYYMLSFIINKYWIINLKRLNIFFKLKVLNLTNNFVFF